MTTERKVSTVAVVGLGLMGGSLCRALKTMDEAPTVLGFDSRAVEGALALESGAVDRYETEVGDGLRDADVVVYATPLSQTLQLIGEHAASVGPEAVVTDMVSLKAPVLGAAKATGIASRFVGAHPICGGEGSGFGAGRADLFRGARVWLCVDDEATPESRSGIEDFWSRVGATTSWTDAKAHDERMAWVSHLPQLVSNALAGALDAAGCSRDELGPGGHDMTRLAGSNPEIWKDLLQASAPVTGVGLTSVANALNVLADLLARREVDLIAEFMERTRNWSRREP